MDAIRLFRGEHEFLSNFHLRPIRLNAPGLAGIAMVAGENPFQALKTLDLVERERIARLPKPGLARRAGRRRTMPDGSVFLRPDWERAKTPAMVAVVDAKFDEDEMARRMLATGWALLMEGTSRRVTGHVDTCWGFDLDTGLGENRLGRIEMVKRACLAIRYGAGLPPLEPSSAAVPLYAVRVRAADGLALPVAATARPDGDLAYLLETGGESVRVLRAEIPAGRNAVVRRSSPSAGLDGLLIPAAAGDALRAA